MKNLRYVRSTKREFTVYSIQSKYLGIVNHLQNIYDIRVYFDKNYIVHNFYIGIFHYNGRQFVYFLKIIVFLKLKILLLS